MSKWQLIIFVVLFHQLPNHVNKIIFLSFISHFFLVEPINLNRKANLKVDAYHCGYHNGMYDTYEYIENHVNNDQFLPDLIHYMKEKEVQLKNLTG